MLHFFEKKNTVKYLKTSFSYVGHEIEGQKTMICFISKTQNKFYSDQYGGVIV